MEKEKSFFNYILFNIWYIVGVKLMCNELINVGNS